MIASSGEPAIVMEDDVLSNTPDRFNLVEIIGEGRGFDYIDLAGGLDLPITQYDSCSYQLHNTKLLSMYPPRSRTTACYYIDNKAALALALTISNIILPLDWSQHAFLYHNFKVGWTQPLSNMEVSYFESSIQ